MCCRRSTGRSTRRSVATEVKLPRLGQGMESGTIVRWLKSEGEPVEKGEPLYELDTDKVTQEVEADASGVLLRIAVQEGEVEVGHTIAVIGKEGESVPDEAPAPEEPAKPEAKPEAPAPQTLQQTVARTDGRDGGRIKASPLARRIARERRIELSSLKGTGPEGRIVAEDVERAAAEPAPTLAAAPPAEAELVPLTSLRRTIARRMTEAWQAPAFQISMSADMTRSQGLHDRLAEQTKEGEPRPTVTDILTKACAAALMRHRAVNALWAEDAIELHPSANIGIAVAIDAGLVVPVIHQAERLAIAELAAARADIVTRARASQLRQEDLDGGTFTISNLGMFGVERFVAVLDPPQAAILAVGAIESKAVPTDTGLEARPP